MNKETLILNIDLHQSLFRATEIIKSGGIIAFPTDTVYGIGVSAFNKDAIEEIYQIKRRPKEKAIPILMGDQTELIKITPPPGERVQKILAAFWPGALTLILPLLSELPANLSNTGTIGVRVPDHNLTRELLRLTGPLAATSANLSGQKSALSAEEVLKNLGGKLDLILDGGRSLGRVASTVLDFTGEQPTVLREGPISWEQIKLLISPRII
jgi:L-threonylcarbamoyladenylate synthase